MNFLTSVLLKRDSYCLVHKSFGLSCLQSRSPVESCRLWAIWTHTPQGQTCLFSPFKLSCVETCDLVPWWDCTSFLPVVTGCSPLSVLSLLLLAPLGGAIFRVLGELHLMFLSFQGGNLIFSMGGIWRPRPGQEPSLHEQEWGWTWPPRKSGSSPAGGVSRPVHCLLSVALSLQMLS